MNNTQAKLAKVGDQICVVKNALDGFQQDLIFCCHLDSETFDQKTMSICSGFVGYIEVVIKLLEESKQKIITDLLD